MKKTSKMAMAFALAAGAAIGGSFVPDLIPSGAANHTAAFNQRSGEAGRMANAVRLITPVCHAANGRKVQFRMINSAQMAARDAALGVATSNFFGKPIIYYDGPALARAPVAVANFVLYHECAHHELGHTAKRDFGPNREIDTDCRAMNRLVREKRYGRFEVKVIMDYFNKYLGNAPVSYYYPPMTERMKKLDACYRAIKP